MRPTLPIVSKWAVALVVMFAAARAPASTESGAECSEARLQFIETTLRDQAQRARWWSWTWIGIGTAVVAENATVAALTTSKAERTDAIIVGAASLFIPALIIAKPLRVMSDARELDTKLDVCPALARAEMLLARDAEDEADGVGWVAHGLAIGGNAAVAVILGFGLGHWRNAAINGVGGLVLNELQIWTQPTGASKSACAGPIDAVGRIQVAPLPHARGVVLSLRF